MGFNSAFKGLMKLKLMEFDKERSDECQTLVLTTSNVKTRYLSPPKDRAITNHFQCILYDTLIPLSCIASSFSKRQYLILQIFPIFLGVLKIVSFILFYRQVNFPYGMPYLLFILNKGKSSFWF